MRSHSEPDERILAAVRRLLDFRQHERDAAEAMALLVAETAKLPLKNLETWERRLRSELYRRASSGTSQIPLWLDLCSGDGFARERTLRTLAEGAPNGFFFALTLRRLNDWVPEVRAAARGTIPSIARRSRPEYVLDALWTTLPHWSSWGRAEYSDRQILQELLSIQQVAVGLKERIVSAASGPAVSVFAEGCRGAFLDEWLPEIARTAIQPSVRANAYRFQLEGRALWVSGRQGVWTDLKWCKGRFQPILQERNLSIKTIPRDVLREALADRSAIVRRVAAEFLVAHRDSLGPQALGFAQQLASDSSPSVAERGRFALSKLTGRA